MSDDLYFCELEEWTPEEFCSFFGICKPTFISYSKKEDFPSPCGYILIPKAQSEKDERILTPLFNRDLVFYWIFTSPNLKIKNKLARKILNYGKWY